MRRAHFRREEERPVNALTIHSPTPVRPSRTGNALPDRDLVTEGDAPKAPDSDPNLQPKVPLVSKSPQPQGSTTRNFLLARGRDPAGVPKKEFPGGNFIADYLDEGQNLQLDRRRNISLWFDDFQDEFHHARAFAEKNSGVARDYLGKLGSSFDPEIFALLSGFTHRMNVMLRCASAEDNRDYYQSRPRSLFSIFANEKQTAAEIAIVAQAFLQQAGVDSSFVRGTVSRKDAASGEGYFIVFRHGGKSYAFDPAHPNRAGDALVPAIFTGDFDALTRGATLRGRDVLTKQAATFGV